MQLDFSQLDAAQAYRWLSATITPRPIAWVSTRSPEGRDNLAPFSFFQIVNDDPPTLLINIGHRADGSFKDSTRNLLAGSELVVQLVDRACAERMNASAASLDYGVSEFDHCEIASLPAERVAALRVADAPVAFECRLAQAMPYPAEKPNCHLIFAEVLLAHIDDRVLHEGRIDPAALDLVGRLSGASYSTTRDRFDMRRPS